MGNFSRNTFDRLKHYVGVRLQQGVPLVDADWNEQEDIRKFELQAFLKWFVGNGVPRGNDGFRIIAASNPNNFLIQGGDGTAEGAGRCIVEGLDVMNESSLLYVSQPLYDNATLAGMWGVSPISPLTTPTSDRIDVVYLDVWEREVDGTEDDNLVNPAIGVETCVRLRREWAVRVAEETETLPSAPAGHAFYALSVLKRPAGNSLISSTHIQDVRSVGLNLGNLVDEIRDARGMKGNLGNRLDESLTRGGQLRHNVVGNDQVIAGAGIQEAKILFNATGHDHSGGNNGNPIGTNGLENSAVSAAKLANDAVVATKIHDDAVTKPKLDDNAVSRNKLDMDIVNSGSVVDLAPGASALQLVQSNVGYGVGLKRVYMPVVAITAVTGSGIANITNQLIYRSSAGRDTYDVYIRISNESGGTEQADVTWYVYIFAED